MFLYLVCDLDNTVFKNCTGDTNSFQAAGLVINFAVNSNKLLY